ncbi:hypothetical protein [Krasilnikovia sp. MM14-A1259]|uniref:hypothetical protein n=1 Tax=Krasilnikovia sp. MM14-A1259 TaxID=3373539 RepID=UPI00399C5AC1
MTMLLFVAVVAALLLGFLSGLLSFKVKNRWCPQCGGSTLVCPPIEGGGGQRV